LWVGLGLAEFLGRSDCQCVEEEILLMAATGVTIDPDISGRDDPTAMLCLVAQMSVLFGTHLKGTI
jgi:hypothetical protein